MEPFGIVVGNGWCDVIAITDLEFRSKWGTLVRNGHWNETLTLKYIGHTIQAKHQSGEDGADEPVDRMVRKFRDATVSVALKKVRKGDINCESAIKIVWSVV